MRTFSTLLICVAAATTFAAQQSAFLRVSEAQARQAMAVASAAAKGSERAFSTQFDKEIKKIAPDYEYDLMNDRLILGSLTGALAIRVIGPVLRLRENASEAIRKLDPLDQVTWTDGVAVVVIVQQITAPDIVKIVVTRDGRNVDPWFNGLAPAEQTTRLGAKTILHEGTVLFPADAFNPGAPVTVTAIPASGRNIVRTFTDKELRKIQ
jgi:hypothetical protein